MFTTHWMYLERFTGYGVLSVTGQDGVVVRQYFGYRTPDFSYLHERTDRTCNELWF